MNQLNSILIEGYKPEEILAFPDEAIKAWVFVDDPIVFKIGSAEILGAFKVESNKLIIELAQIDGGGEGVLPTLWLLARQYAIRNELDCVEWFIHAVYCAKPNLKLQRVMQRRGFVIQDVAEVGMVYHYTDQVWEKILKTDD
jgi:hypothetical protein